MDNYTLILDFIDYKLHLYSFRSRMADMAFKRSAVRSHLSPQTAINNPEIKWFRGFSFVSRTFLLVFCFWTIKTIPLIFLWILKCSSGAIMARITMRKVQETKLSEVFTLYLASAAARGVKDKTLRTYEQHFNAISKRLDVDSNISLISVR